MMASSERKLRIHSQSKSPVRLQYYYYITARFKTQPTSWPLLPRARMRACMHPDPIISLSGTLNITASSEHQNPSQDNVSSQTRDVTSLSSSQSCTMLSQTIINPSPTHPSDSQTSTSSPSLPSRGKFSERIITRDLNSLRQDVRTIKVEINSLRRQSTPATPGEFKLEVCRELKVLKQELAHLRESMYTRHAECQNQNQIQNLQAHNLDHNLLLIHANNPLSSIPSQSQHGIAGVWQILFRISTISLKLAQILLPLLNIGCGHII